MLLLVIDDQFGLRWNRKSFNYRNLGLAEREGSLTHFPGHLI